MHAVVINSHINVHNVAIGQLVHVRDTVAYNLINGRTARLGHGVP